MHRFQKYNILEYAINVNKWYSHFVAFTCFFYDISFPTLMGVEGYADDNKRHRLKFHKNQPGDTFATFGTGTCHHKSIDVIL